MKTSRMGGEDDDMGFGHMGLKTSMETSGITTHYPVGYVKPEVLARFTDFIILKVQMKVGTR